MLLQMALFHSSLCLLNIPLCVCVCVCVCVSLCAPHIYPFTVDWHLGCSSVLAVVNSAATNSGVCISFQIRVFST